MARVRYLLVPVFLGTALVSHGPTAAAAETANRRAVATTPVDPVVQEPLRPLLPPSLEGWNLDDPGCGAPGGFMLSTAFLLTQLLFRTPECRRTRKAASAKKRRCQT